MVSRGNEGGILTFLNKYFEHLLNQNKSIILVFLFLYLVGFKVLASNAESDSQIDLSPIDCELSLIPNHENIVKNLSQKDIDEGNNMVSLLTRLEPNIKADTNAMLLAERYSLNDFLKLGEQNLANKYPLTIMNSAQRALAIIYSQGIEKAKLRVTGDTVNIYHIFSNGLPEVRGRKIVGNQKVIETFVLNLKKQATRDRSGAKPLLLMGPHGTGKSEFLTILAYAFDSLTGAANSKFGYVSYTFVNLGKIDELRPYLNSSIENGVVKYVDIDSPLSDSPFTLFPSDVQDLILSEATPKAQAFLAGMIPEAVRTPDPISEFIRNQILLHYTKERGHALSIQEIIEVLNEHVVVRRQPLGKSSGNLPVIDAQGNDLDKGGLFMEVNPLVRFTSGPTHVMSWHLTGKILKGHGNLIMFDEYLRNKEEFKDMLLRAFESRVISIGGAPDVPFDSVMIAASNTANYEELKADSFGKGAAALDRFQITPMRWSVDPHEIAQILVLPVISQLRVQSLDDTEDREVKKASFLDLFPRSQSLQEFKKHMPDYRYRVWANDGVDRVEISPLTILMMSEIIAATRMRTSPQEADKVFGGKISTSTIFRNPIDRLRFYEGERPNVTPSEVKELVKVSLLLKEGESGIGARSAETWFAESINLARESVSKTLTPTIAIKVFNHLLNQGTIEYGSIKEKMTWEGLRDEVINQLLVPRLEMDINRSLSDGDKVVSIAYIDILNEMFTLHQDPQARTYVNSDTGDEKIIDRERLAKVTEIYKRKYGQMINLASIALFHADILNSGQKRSVSRTEPNPELLSAVAEYYASNNARIVSLEDISDYQRIGHGGDDVVTASKTLYHAMEKLGYNKYAVKEAINLVSFYRAQSQKPNGR